MCKIKIFQWMECECESTFVHQSFSVYRTVSIASGVSGTELACGGNGHQSCGNDARAFHVVLC